MTTSVLRSPPRPSIPGSDDGRELLGVAGHRFDLAEVALVQRLVGPHGGADGADQEAQVAPLDLQVIELQDGSSLEQARQVRGVEPDGRQRHARLDAPLQLEELDLEVNGGGQVRLLFLELAQLEDLARF